MAGWIQTELKKLFSAFQAKEAPIEQEVIADVKAIGGAAITYIETNGLQAAYDIAKALLAGAATGTPWATLGATLLAQLEAAGISIAKGAEAIILGQAQADLIATGSLISPTSGTVVTPAQ